MLSTLSGPDQATYDTIFRHPVSHNLEWRSVIAVFNHLGDLEEEPNGKMKFTRNGKTLTLHATDKDVEVEEIMHIRHFLQESDASEEEIASGLSDLMVVIDHAGAKIFRVSGSETKPEHVVPMDPSGHDQQVHNPRGDSGGKQGPLRKLFYETLAEKLDGTDRILLIGDGQGASNQAEHFLAELKENHKQLAEHVAGVEVADLSHMTDQDFVAKALEFFKG